jgi:hypothetical protein
MKIIVKKNRMSFFKIFQKPNELFQTIMRVGPKSVESHFDFEMVDQSRNKKEKTYKLKEEKSTS